MKSKAQSYILLLLSISFLTLSSYLVVRIYLFIGTSFFWYEKFFAIGLLLAEIFIIIHTFGYTYNIYYVLRYGMEEKPKIPKAAEYPPVAVIVATYKEPLDILEDTLICFYNMTYPNKRLYCLDDTRYELPWASEEVKQAYRRDIEKLCERIGVNLFRSKWHGAKAGKINDFIDFISGNIKEGFEFTAYDGLKERTPEKYILVFDADSNPVPNIAEELVDIAEYYPNVSFVQTPQYYTNFETNRVARASGLQQAIFYEYICEGKGLKNSMFCCGTNVLLRREALLDAGGFDETSVTEDFATSLRLHIKGWASYYLNRVCSFGMGPEDLGAYFKQQFRWAAGNIGILKRLPGVFFRHYKELGFNKCWEYFLSCTHYFVGWVFCFIVLAPVSYLIFNLPSFSARPIIYLGAYIPYMIITCLIFFLSLKARRYRAKDLATTLLLNAVSFSVYIKATISGLFGLKTSFVITPKGHSNILPLTRLLPQIGLCLLCVAAITWGIMRMIVEQEPIFALITNILWCLCNFLMISSVMYFNHSEETAT